MQKRQYKPNKKGGALLPLCATAGIAVALLCVWFALPAHRQNAAATSAESTESIESIESTESTLLTVRTEPTAGTELPPVTEVIVTETESLLPASSLPLLVDEPENVKRIENFLLFDRDSDEYRLAYLLLEGVPTVCRALDEETTAPETSAAAEPAEVTETAETSGTSEASETSVTSESSETAETTETTEVPEIRYMDVDGTVSVYYKDLTDGETWIFNADKKHFAASMIKAVYIYTLLRAADEETLSLDGEIVYKTAMLVEGSGDFKTVADGTVFTYKKLIDLAVRRSDNTALVLLQKKYGFALFEGVMQADGLEPRYRNWWNTDAAQYGAFFEKLYAYFETESENALWLRDLMCRSLQSNMLQKAFAPEKVAHKYGWDRNSYCDGAIVLHEKHPYVVVFMSNLDEGHLRRDNTAFIAQVGGLIKSIHDKKWEVRDAEAVQE